MKSLADSPNARLLAIGTANPCRQYTQAEILRLFNVSDRRIASIFRNCNIKTRHLCLPEPHAGRIPEESSLELAEKHQKRAVELGKAAIKTALESVGLASQDIDYLACVTSTGFLCPSLTAYYIRDLELRPNVHRIDIAGMGCNGGLNGLQPVVDYCVHYPAKIGVLLCVEICSAMYEFKETLMTGVVNSLFGDGAAAAVLCAGARKVELRPELLGFESHIITSQIDSMRINFDGEKYSFSLEREIPYVIGDNVEKPIDRLLSRFKLKRRDVAHWVFHAGGRKVIDAIKYSLGISGYDVRHTTSVLADKGNLSSGSFLFSCQRLLDEGIAESGDYLMLVAMGPGASIECCLGRFG